MKKSILLIYLLLFITIFLPIFNVELFGQNETPAKSYEITSEEEINQGKSSKTDETKNDSVKKQESNQTFIGSVLKEIDQALDGLLLFLWSIIRIYFFIFFIFLLVWFIRLLPKRRHSLTVLQIVNETGITGELEGVASGIDDLLISRLQNIGEKSRISQVKHYWLSPSGVTGETEKEQKTIAQLSNIMGGGCPMDLQKLGDISVGPVKIPLGTTITFFKKILGGNYVSGAIQKYGKINKIILKLEKGSSVFKRNIRYFEVTWSSENNRIEDISEGVPNVIDNLAYMITLDLAEDIETKDWNAYKYFLEGNLAFHDFDDNRTRKDRLRDAINHWRKSVRLDQDFAKAHYNLGIALDFDGKYGDAIFRYQKVINMNPELVGAEARYNLAKIYWDIYKDETKTLEELKKAENLEPNLSNIFNLKGLVFSNRMEDKKAADMYEKAIKLNKGELNPVFYYNLSVAKYYLNDYNAAQKAGEMAIDIYGGEDNVKGLLQTMGLIHIKKGEYKKALSYFEKGLMREPGNRAILDGYGEACRECGYLDKALLIQRRLIRLWPEYNRGYSEIAKTLRRLEKPEDEVIPYEKIGIALTNNDLQKALTKKDLHQFQEKFEATIDLKTATLLQQKIFASVMGGISCFYFKKYNDVNGFFKKMFQKEFKDIKFLLEAEVLHIYGNTLRKLGEQEEKAKQLDISVNFYNLAAKTLEDAVCLYREEQFYDLAQCYSDLAQCYSDLAQCYSDLAESYVKINLFKKVDAAYRKSIDFYKKADAAYRKSIDFYKKEKLFNFASDTHVKDAECLMKGSRAGGSEILYDWAETECEKAILLDNSNHRAFHMKGTIYYDFQRYAKAIPQYEKSVEIKYDLPGAHYNLGLCYKYLGKYEEAAKKFETTIKIDEKFADENNQNEPDPYEQLSICLEKLGRLDRAVETLRNVSDMFPLSIKYHLLLGRFLVKCNLLDEASKQFKSYLYIDKNNTQNLKHLALKSMADLYAEQGADIDNAYKMCRTALVICKHKVKDKKVKSKLVSDEDLSSIRNTLGWIFYQKGQVGKAVIFLEKSLIHALGNPKSHSRLAQAYKKYSKMCSDPITKADYLEKFKTQRKIVIDLDKQNAGER